MEGSRKSHKIQRVILYLHSFAHGNIYESGAPPKSASARDAKIRGGNGAVVGLSFTVAGGRNLPAVVLHHRLRHLSFLRRAAQ